MATYYISPTGNDSNTGLSEGQAWATDTNLQAIMSGAGLDPNDIVLRESEGEWYIDGNISIPTQNDGSNGNPITFGSYGTGDKPIISNLKTLTGFTNVSGNIWEMADPDFDYPSLLKLDGQPRAKTQNNKLYATSNGTPTTIISTMIPAYDYTGGEVEVYVEKDKFIYDTAYVSGRSGNTLTIENTSPLYSISEGEFFIVQNAIETLTVDGNWMYSESDKKITIYSTTNPNTRNIQISQKQRTINTLQNTWNTFENLEIRGSNFEAFRTESSQDNVFRNLTFKDIGGGAFYHWTSLRIQIIDCLFDLINGTAIALRNGSENALIQGNTIKNVFSYLGNGRNNDGSQGYAIVGNATGSTIIENNFENIGYVGIRYGGVTCLVQKNFIDGFCTIKDDGGAIYAYITSGSAESRVVNLNIVIGPNRPRKSIVGLYVDDNCSGITLTNNTIIDVTDAGAYIHNSKVCLFTYNTFYNCRVAMLFIHNSPNDTIRNNVFSNNQIVLTTKDQIPYRIVTDLDDINQFGTMNNNLFIICTDREFVVQSRKKIGSKLFFNNFTLSQWRALGYDTGSQVINLNLPEYTGVTTVGSNKFQGSNNSTSFTVITYTGGSATRSVVSIEGNNWLESKATSESSASTNVSLVFTQMGELVEGKKYRASVEIFTDSSHQSVNCYINATDSPYFLRMTEQWAFVVTNTPRTIDIFIDEFEPYSNCAFLVDFQSNQGSIFTRNFQLIEIEGIKTDFTEHVGIIYNNALTTQNVALPTGFWKDVDDNPITSPRSISSFQSELIFSDETPTDPKLGTLLFFEDWEEGNFDNWNDGGEVDSSYIPESASSVISTDFARSGVNSLRMRAKSEGQTNNWRFREISDNEDIIITYHFYFPERIDMVDSFDSFFNLMQFKGVNLSGDFRNDPLWVFGLNVRGGNGSGGANYIGLGYLGQFWPELGLPQYSITPEVTLDIPVGEWFKFQIRYKKSETAGIIQAWQNDVLLFEVRDVVTFPSSLVDEVFTSVNNYGLERLPNNDVDTTNVYLDDISINLLGSSYDFGDPVINPTFSIVFEISNGTATASPSGVQIEGTSIILTANMDEGYEFDGWYLDGELLSMSNPFTFTMPGNDVTIEVRTFEIPDPPVPVPDTGKKKCKTYLNGFFFEYDCGQIEDTTMTVRGIKYKVLEDLEDEPVTVEFLKQHIRVDFDMDDNLIENYLKSARQTLEKYANLSFGVKKIRFSALNLVDNFPLDYGPITSIVDDTYELFGDTVVDACGEKVTFDFITGWEPELPEDIKIAVCQYAAGLYADRENILSGMVRGYMDQAKKVIDGYRNYHVV